VTTDDSSSGLMGITVSTNPRTFLLEKIISECGEYNKVFQQENVFAEFVGLVQHSLIITDLNQACHVTGSLGHVIGKRKEGMS
jgi:hypothetical protein